MTEFLSFFLKVKEKWKGREYETERADRREVMDDGVGWIQPVYPKSLSWRIKTTNYEQNNKNGASRKSHLVL